MARISKQERQKKLEFINEQIWNLFLEKGWSEITYYNVSLKTGMRQSSLQAYHKNANSFGEALKGRAFPYFMDKIELTSIEVLEQSWNNGLKDAGFRNIIWLLIGHVTESEQINTFAHKGLLRLLALVRNELGDDGYATIEKLIGRTAIEMALTYKTIKED